MKHEIAQILEGLWPRKSGADIGRVVPENSSGLLCEDIAGATYNGAGDQRFRLEAKYTRGAFWGFREIVLVYAEIQITQYEHYRSHQ